MMNQINPIQAGPMSGFGATTTGVMRPPMAMPTGMPMQGARPPMAPGPIMSAIQNAPQAPQGFHPFQPGGMLSGNPAVGRGAILQAMHQPNGMGTAPGSMPTGMPIFHPNGQPGQSMPTAGGQPPMAMPTAHPMPMMPQTTQQNLMQATAPKPQPMQQFGATMSMPPAGFGATR